MSQQHSLLNPRSGWRWHFYLDPWLTLGIVLLAAGGSLVVYSAAECDTAVLQAHWMRLGLASLLMLLAAQIPIRWYAIFALPAYLFGVVLLLAVLLVGDIGKGAQRWLDLGFIRFQPSEIMKLAVPATLAWLLAKQHLPPRWPLLILAAIVLTIPIALVVKQPDLGTSLLIATAGAAVIFLAGLSWKIILTLLTLAAAAAPIAWNFIYDYQRQRILTFLNPERDPLGTGYHIIQSKIAIGSGGLEGKGLCNGSQTQLDFLPESHTDFIFSVLAEEWGLIGVSILLLLYLLVLARGFYIAARAQDTFSRLLAGALVISLFVYIFINIGMVSGMLPVVGVPLPLISYGGTSLVTLMLGFGILMSIHAEHQRHLTQCQGGKRWQPVGKKRSF